MWHHYQDISLLLNFYLQLFEVGFFLGPFICLPKCTTIGATCTSSKILYCWFQTLSVAPLSRYLPFINLLPRAQIWGPFLPRNSGLSILPKFATRGATSTSHWKVYDADSSNASQILSHFPLSIPAYIEVLTNQKRREKSPMSLQGYQPKRFGGHSWFLNRI